MVCVEIVSIIVVEDLTVGKTARIHPELQCRQKTLVTGNVVSGRILRRHVWTMPIDRSILKWGA